MFVKAKEDRVTSLVILYIFLLLLVFPGTVVSQTKVSYLPGFDGKLPFKLETGYIEAGHANESQLFYYFVESQRSPAKDPLLLWLTGGPGCTSLFPFFFENGPLKFNYTNYDGRRFPSLQLNKYAWTKRLNILYVDAPVGTGFSYSTTAEGYITDDEKSATQTYQFLKKWLIAHPQYFRNRLLIGGDSYSGIPVPILVQIIINDNEAGKRPYLNIKGYVLGNARTDDFIDANSRVPFAHRLTLISDQMYKSLEGSCGGDYVNVNANNTPCVEAIKAYDQIILPINIEHVLEPSCENVPLKSNANKSNNPLCRRNHDTVPSTIWANDKSVRKALNVRENTVGTWSTCNQSLAYTKTILSTVNYHRNLTHTNLHVLIYSGDHDMQIPHIATQTWIRSLNLTVNETWRPWFVDGQIAGFTEKFLNNHHFTLTYATVKGAGHTAPEYKAKECYEMIDHWLAYYPL